jgi:hypothetical protein
MVGGEVHVNDARRADLRDDEYIGDGEEGVL